MSRIFPSSLHWVVSLWKKFPLIKAFVSDFDEIQNMKSLSNVLNPETIRFYILNNIKLREENLFWHGFLRDLKNCNIFYRCGWKIFFWSISDPLYHRDSKGTNLMSTQFCKVISVPPATCARHLYFALWNSNYSIL